MKKYLLPVFICCLCAQAARGQHDNEAREQYLNAETAYLAGDWNESFRYLLAAENLLDRTTPRLQFLKVLVLEKLALEDIDNLAPALEAARTYLAMGDQLPPLHQKYAPVIQQIATALPAQAQATHEARVRQKRLEEKLAWQAEARKLRVGAAVGMTTGTWTGTEFGLVLGSRSSLWVLGISSTTGLDIVMDNDFNIKMFNKIEGKPYGYVQKSTILHVDYFQGIRVMPREQDIVKPFVGARALYHGEYSRTYEGKTEQQPAPGKEVIDRIRGYGLDPADFYTANTTFKPGFSFDVVVGVMVHLGKSTLFTGIDLINSHRLQVGAAFKVK